jgi:hypothetical protein
MSNVYKQQSSLAAVKWNASMGFHARALHRVCITSLRSAVATRMSYNAMLRSPPQVAKTSASACTRPSDHK